MTEIPLHHVVSSNKWMLLRACVGCTAEQMEIVDEYGNTALLKACYFGSAEVVRVLLNYNANIDAVNYFGQNALTLATYCGSVQTAIDLLKHRSLEQFDKISVIPAVCVAELRGHQKLTKLFKKHMPADYAVQTIHGFSVANIAEMKEVAEYDIHKVTQ